MEALNNSARSMQLEQELANYPPRLRKLALLILNSPSDSTSTTLAEWCREFNMPYNSIRDAVSKARLKGNDYRELINRIAYKRLTYEKPKMYKALVEEGLKGNCKALETYFKLTGDLRSEPRNEGNTTTNNLTFVLAMPRSIEPVNTAIPEHNGGEDHSAIDVSPVQDSEEE